MSLELLEQTWRYWIAKRVVTDGGRLTVPLDESSVVAPVDASNEQEISQSHSYYVENKPPSNPVSSFKTFISVLAQYLHKELCIAVGASSFILTTPDKHVVCSLVEVDHAILLVKALFVQISPQLCPIEGVFTE